MRRAAVAAALLLACGCRRDPGTSAPGELDLSGDPRFVIWTEGCPRRGAFERDTSDMVSLLVATLEGGWRDGLILARQELARRPADALPALRRLVERVWSQPFSELALANALDTAAMMEGGEGRELLARGLAHEATSVRTAALRGLARHASPAEREALLELLDWPAPELWGPTLIALERADPLAYRTDLARWIVEGEREHLWSLGAPSLASCEAATAEILGGAWSRVAVELRPWLAACRARHGDDEARAWLRAQLVGGPAALRIDAVHALAVAGERALLEEALTNPQGESRRIALGGLLPLVPPERASQLLEKALGDTDTEVRRVALVELVRRGDPSAADYALRLLTGAPEERELALQALHGRLAADPLLAARAFELLAAELAARADAPLSAQKGLEAALGQLPEPRAAALLLERAARASAGSRERSSTLTDHRWLVLRAGASGSAGRALVRERWRVEEDPERRLDLLEASLGDPELDRDFLLSVLDSERASAWEALFAADRLARLGPLESLLPRLKRAALECDHPLVRPGFDCLLWSLFGA